MATKFDYGILLGVRWHFYQTKLKVRSRSGKKGKILNVTKTNKNDVCQMQFELSNPMIPCSRRRRRRRHRSSSSQLSCGCMKEMLWLRPHRLVSVSIIWCILTLTLLTMHYSQMSVCMFVFWWRFLLGYKRNAIYIEMPFIVIRRAKNARYCVVTELRWTFYSTE